MVNGFAASLLAEVMRRLEAKLPTQRVSKPAPFSRYYAFPIERPTIWHHFIPSTLLRCVG
jgi:hypothetical protein